MEANVNQARTTSAGRGQTVPYNDAQQHQSRLSVIEQRQSSIHLAAHVTET